MDGRELDWRNDRSKARDAKRYAMSDTVSLIMLQFLDWVSSRTRTYAEAMEAWRTSCPRLSVWEDAQIEGYIQFEGEPSQPTQVVLTPLGNAILETRCGGKVM